MSMEELQSMQRMNHGWEADIAPMMEVLHDAATTFSEIETALSDTSSLGGRAMLRDSVAMSRYRQQSVLYRHWFVSSAAHLKHLEGMVAANKSWFQRLNPGDEAVVKVRRSWDSRRADFYVAHAACRAAMDQYSAWAEPWQEYRARLTGQAAPVPQ